MNFAISSNDFELVLNISYEDFNQFLFNKIIETGKVCGYYIANFRYKGKELTEVFYIDTYNYTVCWLDDWFEGGTIECMFGFVDSKSVSEFVKHYLWTNRYKGGFEHESNHN